MEGFNTETRQSIYFGVGYVIASQWFSDAMKRLDFQKALAEQQLDFPKTSVGPHDFTLVRTEPSALQVKLASLGPRVSSISINSERPVHTLDFFAKEADAVCDAYRRTWLQGQCQILQSNATVRHLYSCKDHAFKMLLGRPARPKSAGLSLFRHATRVRRWAATRYAACERRRRAASD